MKEHPVIEDLQINEDGTEIIHQGKVVSIKTYRKKQKGNYYYRVVCLLSRNITVAKLVCEAYYGMRKDKGYTVQRKDFNPDNDHYTNLFWGKSGSRIRTKKTKRHKNSKIKDSDIPIIVQRIKNGEKLNKIASSYNTSDMTIQRIKKNHITNPEKIFKTAIQNAKNKEEINTLCAKYLKYPSTSVATQKMGKFEFEKEVDNLITEI